MCGCVCDSLEFFHGYFERICFSLQLHHHWSTHAGERMKGERGRRERKEGKEREEGEEGGKERGGERREKKGERGRKVGEEE